AGECVQVGVGEVVDLLPRPRQPVEEAEVVPAEERDHTAPEEGAAELDRPVRRPDVPRVAPAVPVRIPEVVRPPRAPWEPDPRAMRAELGRANHERGVAEPPVG